MAFEFDVFLSYKSCDQEWTSGLKRRLVGAGLRVWMDKDQIRPGDLFVEALEKGLLASCTLVLICSPESLGSRWVLEEYGRALGLMNEADSRRRIIPVLLRDAELPGFLAGRQWVDFRSGTDYEEALRSLLWGISGRWPQPPAPPELADLPEIMLSARSSLLIWGHTLDKFARDPRVKSVLTTLFNRGVRVTLMMLNPYSPYARAHEPFHLLESRSPALEQALETIRFMEVVARFCGEPEGFSIFLTNYMPRFRSILVDDDACYVSLYLYGEDVDTAPEFRVARGDSGFSGRWFESIAESVLRMRQSPSLVPLVSAGKFNPRWDNCRVAASLSNCLSTRCCQGEVDCWAHVRRVVLGYQNNDESLAESFELVRPGYTPGTFTIAEVSASARFLSPTVDFTEWATAALEDDLGLIAKARPEVQQVPGWRGSVQKALDALTFERPLERATLSAGGSAPESLKPLKNQIWYQEYSDVFRRLLLTFLVNDPDCELNLYPELTTERRGLLFDAVKEIERRFRPEPGDWLRLSVAAGLLGIDEKPSHAATSAIHAGRGIRLDRPAEPRQREVIRIADELWDLSHSPCRIDATEVFLLRLHTAQHTFKLVAFSDDYLETIVLLKAYDVLLRRFPHLVIHLVPRAVRCSNDACYADIEEFLDDFPDLKRNPRFVVERNGPKLGGVNLRKLHHSIVELLRECAAVDVRGARNYEMLQGLQKETYFGFMVCRDFSESITGLRADERPFIYIRQQAGEHSFEGFRERNLRSRSGKWLARTTVDDQRARWQGGYLSGYANWPPPRKEAYRLLHVYYQNHADDFDLRFGSLLEDDVKAALDQFTGRVLVVGCGSGKEVNYLHDRGCEGYGFDSSSRAIGLARQRNVGLSDRFWVSDVYDLDLAEPPDHYDGVVANAVLVHLLDRTDLRPTLARFARRLKPGGLCYVRVLEKTGFDQELDSQSEHNPRWFAYWTSEELQSAAAAEGFTIVAKPDRRRHAKHTGVFWISALFTRG